MLPWCSGLWRNACSLKRCGRSWSVQATFAIEIELFHSSEVFHPYAEDTIYQRSFALALDFVASVEAASSANEMKHHMLLVEQYVAFYLLVESNWHRRTDHVVWTWRCPCAAFSASLNNFSTHFQHVIRQSCQAQDVLHRFGFG